MTSIVQPASPRPFIPAAWRLLPALGLACAFSVQALEYTVTDFTSDFAGGAGDTLNLNAGWGDSLFLAPDSHNLRHVLTRTLNDSSNSNGEAGSSPAISYAGDGVFRAAYLAWKNMHLFQSGASIKPTRPDVVIQSFSMGEEAVIVNKVGEVVAMAETRDTTLGIFYAGFNPQPTPHYFNFSARGDKYAAYWGTREIFGPYRRASFADRVGPSPARWARYIPPHDPVITRGYGQISAALRPGGGNFRTVLAYETSYSPPTVEIRWENLDGITSDTVRFGRPNIPEDFAVAVDSAGNALALWRQKDTLWAVTYDENRVQTQAPVPLDTGITYGDGVTTHIYRPYGVKATVNGRFVLVFAKNNRVYYRLLGVPHGGAPFSLGAPQALTNVAHTAFFPDLAVNRTKIVFAWYRRITAANHRMEGALFDLAGGGVAAASRQDFDLAEDEIGFTEVGDSWYPWHYFKSASVAIDDNGNIAAAYDDGFSAKVAVVWHQPVYHDSGLFVGKAIAVENPAVGIAFDPTLDSVEYTAAIPDGAHLANIGISLATAASPVFSGTETFRALDTPFRSNGSHFKYRVVLRPQLPGKNLTSRLRGLELRYNVKPRAPTFDSLAVGENALTSYNPSDTPRLETRRDSLRLSLSGLDLDDGDSLVFVVEMAGIEVARKTVKAKFAPGRYRYDLAFLPPDTVGTAIPIRVRTMDAAGWWSSATVIPVDIFNPPPSDSVYILRRRHGQTVGGYGLLPAPPDTLSLASGSSLTLFRGDTARLRIFFADDNDDSLDLLRLRNGSPVGSGKIPSNQFLEYLLAGDLEPGVVDTLVFRAADNNDTAEYSFKLRTNHLPRLDSVVVVEYQTPQGPVSPGFAKAVAGDTGLWVPAGFDATLRVSVSDPDEPSAASLQTQWRVLAPDSGCAAGDLSCHSISIQGGGDLINHRFEQREAYVEFTVTDSLGAYAAYRYRLEYPKLDTSASTGFTASIGRLQEELDFVLDSKVQSKTITAGISNVGNVPLTILSVKTGNNVEKWMRLQLEWPEDGVERSLLIDKSTEENAVPTGTYLNIDPGGVFNLSFEFFVNSLRGDSVLTDTLFLETNDPSQPVVAIPFRLVHRDLPLFSMGLIGGGAETPDFTRPTSGFNEKGLPAFIPTRTRLAFNFTEPVVANEADKRIRIYSVLDSLANPSGFRFIPGEFSLIRHPASLAKMSRREAGAAVFAPGDSLADQILFTPRYDAPSDSLRVMPPPGYFIQGDLLRVRVSNAFTDAAGNSLDMRLDRELLAPGSFDTLFTLQVDTSVFRVSETFPAHGHTDWDSFAPIRIKFNAPLARLADADGRNTPPIDIQTRRADSNFSVRVTSTAIGGKGHNFRLLRLEPGDSVLTLQTFPSLGGQDTVTVRLASSILDASGRSLDGNGDGLSGYLYNPDDTADYFAFTFITGKQDFYLFPNPYRYSDSRHLEKGGITFKNIHQLRGYTRDKPVILRIYSMTADLLYSSGGRGAGRAGTSASAKGITQLDWDLKNTHGHAMATGVYLYTLTLGEDRLLRKGKVALIR